MIVDCFIFNDEYKLLEYRLKILYDIVDKFVIVEARQTHSGLPKQLNYEKNKSLFKEYEDKIIHIIVDLPYIKPDIDFLNQEQWKNENFQRNCINQGITQIDLNDNDLIMISDVDEIPDPDILLKLKHNSNLIAKGGLSFPLQFHYYNLNTIHTDLWYYAKIVTFKEYKQTTPQQIRFCSYPVIDRICGWHLSYFGTPDKIKQKINSYTHQEYNIELFTDLNSITDKINRGIDLFSRNNVNMVKYNILEIKYLPPLYEIYLQDFVIH
jgi:beta-1,4-mannosyl-glycoprotein beta-1,4-N-acetylglucosaminyltransferase